MKGTIVNFKGNTPQMTSGSQIVSYDDGGGTGGDTPAVNAGTEENPIDCATALSLATALDEYGSIPNAYIKGKISAISELSTSFGNATYTLVDEDGNTTFSVFRGYWFNGDKFTSEDQLAVGAEVVVKGTIVNYKGNTPQLTTGSQIISYNGQSGTTQQTTK